MAYEGIADWIEFNARNISHVPNVPGIYELADITRRIVYINKAAKLSMALTDINANPTICLRSVRYFRVALNPNLLDGLKARLLAFRDSTSEAHPKCNSTRDFPFRTLSS